MVRELLAAGADVNHTKQEKEGGTALCWAAYYGHLETTQALIDAHTPNWVLSVGFSGGLTPALKIGDIVVANSIVDTTGVRRPIFFLRFSMTDRVCRYDIFST